MFQGTSSNAGKSLLTAALCRLLSREGLRVAPFKAQNMSLNSFVTADGGEMGRAQAIQAAACGLDADVRMNPVLLKPTSDTGSQVIVLGRPVGYMRVKAYFHYKPQAWKAVCRAYRSLAAEVDVMVLEGAGSPAEINLRQHDIVNMRMARYAGAKVALVADIDRGGAFAALAGTMTLLSRTDRARVAGFVLNKFRGDASLLDTALQTVSRRTGKPFLGIVPMLDNLCLPEEDSVNFKAGLTPGFCRDSTSVNTACVDIVVPDLPHISNATDLDSLRAESCVNVRIVRRPEQWGTPHMVIVPGSRNTVEDMRWLRTVNLEERIRSFASDCLEKGHGMLIGICGGLQMLGTQIDDPLNLESGGLEQALGILPLSTQLHATKCLRRTTCIPDVSLVGGIKKVFLTGYEIHHGVTIMNKTPCRTSETSLRELLHDTDGRPLGWGQCDKQGCARIWGTYLHGLFDTDVFRHELLNTIRREEGLPVMPGQPYKLGSELDRLADTVASALDMPAIFALLGVG